MIEKVIRYLTSDGREFASEEEARENETAWQLERKLEDCEHYCHGGLRGVENIDDLVKFLNDNREWILDLMRWEVRGNGYIE